MKARLAKICPLLPSAVLRSLPDHSIRVLCLLSDEKKYNTSSRIANRFDLKIAHFQNKLPELCYTEPKGGMIKITSM